MNGVGATSAEGLSEEAPGLSRKKVANAVRKVVNRVLPGEEPGSAKEPPSRGVRSPEHPARGKKGEKAAPGPKPPPPPPPPPPAPPKPEAKKETGKDELSVGLRSLMSRGRGKDHKPRNRQPPGKGEKPSSQEPGSSGKPGSPEVVDSPAKPGTPEEQCSPAPPEEPADSGSAGPKAHLPGLQQCKSPVPDVQQEVPECVTNLPCPSPPSLEVQAPSRSASPRLRHQPRMMERRGRASAGCGAAWLLWTECQGPWWPGSALGPANQHAAVPWDSGPGP